MDNDTCIVDGCERPVKVKKRGLCSAHYQKQWQADQLSGVAAQRRSALPTACTVDGCGRKVAVKTAGLCGAHYQRMRSTGSPLGSGSTLRADMPTVCTVVGCSEPVLATGWCSAHYAHNKLHGDPIVKQYRPYQPPYKGESPEYVRDAVANRERTDACWIDGGFSVRSGGYPMLSGNPVGYLSMEADGRPRTGSAYQLHSCDNPPCWAPHHLRWGTPQENADDRGSRDRHVALRGEDHGMSVLTEEQVRWVRSTYEAGKDLPQRHPDKVSAREMARQLGVSVFPIHSIIKGRTWQHVK